VTDVLLFDAAVDMAHRIWEIQPVRGVRMPGLDSQPTALIDVLWTDRGLRPNATNLAFFIQRVDNSDELGKWRERLAVWPIRGGLVVTPEELHLLQPRSSSSGDLEHTVLNLDTWRETLVSPKPHLFTPKALARLREGQLSLADLEETVSERSFTFLLRQKARIDEAFQNAVEAALAVTGASEESSRAEIEGHVIRYSIAYLAARILQDKNFFGSGSTIHDSDQDPVTLLNRMIILTNGFFSRAKDSEAYVHDRVRKALVEHMGYNVSFLLTDHRDVGRLYERAIKALPAPDDLKGDVWGDLNRHYTPVKIAERMLEALPLERLRPEERYIFDPAAGSGSLLLAATSRLAGMTDIPTGENRKAFLRSHVAGNDLDTYARLVTKLRYFLASETLSLASEEVKISDILPSPEHFTNNDYLSITKSSLSNRPRVIIANPPFAIEGNIQKSNEFIGQVLSWLQTGDQFAFVLPTSFLTGEKFGVSSVRRRLSSECELFEVWQCPEGSVGVNARQDACVVVGAVGKRRCQTVISKSTISRAESNEVREIGYLGTAWLASTPDDANWSMLVSPQIRLSVPTIPLGSLFFVFNGVKHQSGMSPVEHCPRNKICKPAWRMNWLEKGSIWADPQSVNAKEKWVIYDPEFLERPRPEVQELFEKPKILVGLIANVASQRPIVAALDTHGFCPNNNVWCLLPTQEAQRRNKEFSAISSLPKGWKNLTFEEQELWLIGILNSSILAALSMPGRANVHLTRNILLNLPLPLVVDRRIIDMTRKIMLVHEGFESESLIRDLYIELNRFVNQSYGNPIWKPRQRTGKTPELESYKLEQAKVTKMAIGQILEISEDKSQILMYLSRLMSDDEAEGEWMPIPQELPGWALDGTPFEVEISHDVKTFEQLRDQPWALRRFRHTPRPYLTDAELDTFLSIPELEV
jgi:hypothetical protein